MLSKTTSKLEKELAQLRGLIKEEDNILARLRGIQSHHGEGLNEADLIDMWLSEAYLTTLTSQVATQILVVDELLRRLDCKGEGEIIQEKFRERNNNEFEELVSKAEQQFADEIAINKFCRKVRKMPLKLKQNK